MNISRRQALTSLGFATFASQITGLTALANSETSSPKISSKLAIRYLQEGNQRYVQQQALRPRQGQQTRLKIAKGQTPFAIVLGCADSRVAPETIFDQGLGDLFVIRVAGNIVDDVVLGSIQFAVAEFGVAAIMVLGHERCGAVIAALDVAENSTVLPGSISALVEPILPAAREARTRTGDIVDIAVRLNVRNTVYKLKSDPLLKEFLEKGQLQVVGGRYDLESGLISFIA